MESHKTCSKPPSRWMLWCAFWRDPAVFFDIFFRCAGCWVSEYQRLNLWTPQKKTCVMLTTCLTIIVLYSNQCRICFFFDYDYKLQITSVPIGYSTIIAVSILWCLNFKGSLQRVQFYRWCICRICETKTSGCRSIYHTQCLLDDKQVLQQQ